MLFHLFRCGALLLVLLCSACSLPSVPRHPDQLQYAPLTFHIPAVERRTLSNGIRLYLREDHELPLVQLSAMLAGGAIEEPADLTGLAGLFATTLRTGGTLSHSPADFDAALEELAANLSVGTDTYATNVGLSLQSSDLEAGLQLLGEMLRAPRFAEERLELARKQAIEGIRRRNDAPGSIAQRVLRETLYAGHPLGRTASVASVSRVSRADLLAFHARNFHPNNLWLAVSGDFDPETLVESLERLFEDWPQGDLASPILPPVTTPARPVVLLADKQLPQTTILFGELGISKDHPDLHALKVMNFILGGGGFNSRLMREVRSNRGLAYSVYSGYQVGRRLPGPFMAGAETKSGSTLEVVRLMEGIMQELRGAPVSEAELQLAKESLINSFVFAFDDSHAVVSQIMRLDYYDYPADYLESFRDRIAVVSLADVQRVARQHLDPRRQTLVLVGNPQAFDGAAADLGRSVEPVLLSDE